MKPSINLLYTVLFLVVFSFSCKKEKEEVTFTGNDIPEYNQIPRLLIENYVNRLFIDLIGREPTDVEMTTEVDAMRATNASVESRTALVNKIMTSTAPLPGDGSYREAYIRKFYEDQKGRFLEGASDGTITDEYYLYRILATQDSLNGNMLAYQILTLEANKILAVLDSREELMNGEIVLEEMCSRMMFNALYDEINMNTFNFINASFDDCFARFPTQSEYEGVEDAIEFNGAGVLFGNAVSSKTEYLNVLVNSNEFDEGFVRWAYFALLAREATSNEVFSRVQIYRQGSNFSGVQKEILISDEYAGF
ncbi:MAG: hypothetical protein ACK4WD_06085 [Flavobacteriales bacterium]|jgi:hypothetical protein